MTPEQRNSISDYISRHLPIEGELHFKAFKGGASNLTYSVKDEHQEWIMRTSPPGTKAKGAHNMHREYTLLQNIHPVFPLCPEVVLLCQEHDVFERDFYLMKPINGIIIRQQLPEIYINTDLSLLCKELIKVHHQLHQARLHTVAVHNIFGRQHNEPRPEAVHLPQFEPEGFVHPRFPDQ